LKLSLYPFSHGLPGSMKRVFAPIFLIQSLTLLAVNSGPLSDLMYSGTPRRTINSVSVASTSSDRSLAATLIARHSLLHSSITVSSLMGLPEYVRQATKSYAQTWSSLSGRSLVIELSPSQSWPRFGCFIGTLNPSRLHMRSTLLWFTCHAISFSRAVILRYPYRPNLVARLMMSALRASSSSRTLGAWRCVDRG
jgi:hypothetical protein